MVQVMLKDGCWISQQVAKMRLGFDQLLRFILFQTGLLASDLRAFFVTFPPALDVCLPLESPIDTPLRAFSLGLSRRGNPFSAVNKTGLLADRRMIARALVYRRVGPKGVERKIRTKQKGKPARTGELPGPFVP